MILSHLTFLWLSDSCRSAADSSWPWMSLTCSYCVSLLCHRGLRVLLISGRVCSWSATIGPLVCHSSVKGQSLTLGCVRQAVLIWTCARRATGRDFIRLSYVAKENLGVVQDSYGGSSPIFLYTKGNVTLCCTHECLCRRQSLIWVTEYIVFRHKLKFFVFHDMVFEHVWWLNDAVSSGLCNGQWEWPATGL